MVMQLLEDKYTTIALKVYPGKQTNNVVNYHILLFTLTMVNDKLYSGTTLYLLDVILGLPLANQTFTAVH